MTLWGIRDLGVLFGGVTDEDTNEETLESVFHNDLCVFAVDGYIVQLNAKFTDMDTSLRVMAVGFL